MDPASRIIGQWAGAADMIAPDRVVCSVWARAVGKTVAQRTRAVKMVRTTLVVEVEDELWQRNLRTLQGQILRNLIKAVGPDLVTDLEFRIMPRRRPPERQTSTEDVVLRPPDDADAIADPGLRRIYKADRRRQTA
jgi:predicted nucleic acid-binding Zn ribbon protein